MITTFQPLDLLTMMPDHKTLRTDRSLAGRKPPKATQVDIATGIDRFLTTWAEFLGEGENHIFVQRMKDNAIKVSITPLTASGKVGGIPYAFTIRVTEGK